MCHKWRQTNKKSKQTNNKKRNKTKQTNSSAAQPHWVGVRPSASRASPAAAAASPHSWPCFVTRREFNPVSTGEKSMGPTKKPVEQYLRGTRKVVVDILGTEQSFFEIMALCDCKFHGCGKFDPQWPRRQVGVDQRMDGLVEHRPQFSHRNPTAPRPLVT